MKCRPSQSHLSIYTALFSFLFASFLLTAALYETTEAGDTLTSQRVLLAAAKAPAKASKGFDWKKLGAQVYTNTCAACHQPNGQGVPNTFPPLKGNAVVLAKDPKDHIQSILKGVQGKKIGGVAYQTPMPPQANLSDEEIAAVVNHERTSWGNNAPTLTPEDVKKLRGK
ncbi:MAG: cytochrome c [Candidatus Tectomicrobia bacterium]|uniref:Cytochrome c n=1 Tax=Tectimicrobiota bacterium TaxID=2528274 RepID=A0A932M024_UNCTE|nr:cytochrome c [Candidatus Tectomicrobia bacterium]